ncbi:MAG: hypothetical protein JXR49_11070 [Acidobacteria bacterium]|nr:hypothetical protein [Acidobacteriota bacterium]
MSDRILIVRTINVEEMGPLLDACRSRWPSARICVLTSPNRREELCSDGRIGEAIEYSASGSGFGSPWNDGRDYDALVVPIRNARGWGYGNVWESVAAVTAKSFWVAAWSHNLRSVSLRRMLFRARMERFLGFACGIGARGFAYLFLLRCRLRKNRKGS